VNKKRFFVKLGLLFALSFGIYKGADAAAPAPQLTQVFNNATAVPSETAKEYRLPQLKEPTAEEAKNLWRVRVGAWEIGAGGYHTFLEFSPYQQTDAEKMKKKDVYQLHGIACDEVRHTWAMLDYKKSGSFTQYFNGDYVLKGMGVVQDHERKYFADRTTAYVDIYYGSKEEVLKMFLDGMQIADKISHDNKPYILLDHNSNSAERTYREALGLPDQPIFVPYRIFALGGRIWTPGLEKSLLPEGYDRHKVRAEADYKDFTADQLEARAKSLCGSERMFSTFRTPPPPKAH
jgi:hypothetical protein